MGAFVIVLSLIFSFMQDAVASGTPGVALATRSVVKTNERVMKWTNEDVQKWISKHNLQR